MQETTTQLMQQALYWCHRDESMGREFLQAYYEGYMREKHEYVSMCYPSPRRVQRARCCRPALALEKMEGS